jgi:transposase
MRRAAENLIAKYHVQSLVQYQIEVLPKAQNTQVTLRLPVRQVVRKRVIKPTPVLSAQQNLVAIARAATLDGTFPLLTNTDLCPLEVLQKYKYQPHLEKRHFLNKTVLEISPVFLKNNIRVEALMLVYFVAQLVAALFERVVRQNMRLRAIKALPILPEQRESKTPSFAQIRETFASRIKAELYDHDLKIKSFVAPLTDLQQTLLQLLEIKATVYS